MTKNTDCFKQSGFGLEFGFILNFEIVSNFDIRISNLANAWRDQKR
jgi:hypothetical protein